MTCGYCWKRKKRKELGNFDARNGERVPICKSCCKKIFKCTLKKLEQYSEELWGQQCRVCRGTGHTAVEGRPGYWQKPACRSCNGLGVDKKYYLKMSAPSKTKKKS